VKLEIINSPDSQGGLFRKAPPSDISQKITDGESNDEFKRDLCFHMQLTDVASISNKHIIPRS
jgi:hypothetical protein